MTVICSVESYHWRITTRAIGATRVVQVHTFRNIHNQSIADASFGQPVVRTKQGRCMVDDVIRGSPDYFPRQLCKDFV